MSRAGLIVHVVLWAPLVLLCLLSRLDGVAGDFNQQILDDPITAKNPAPVVHLTQGIFVGDRKVVSYDWGNTTIKRFLGIPYANHPARFRPPKEPIRMAGVQDATRSRDCCIQADSKLVGKSPEIFNQTEDCLNINLWAPATGGLKPVMVWFYGGGFMFGRNSNFFYDGSHLAAHDVVFVAPNYRVNVFGFPGLVNGIPVTESNLGLLDQRMALKWVKENIEKFGGDPNMITVMGQSAGAISIDHHLAAFDQATVPFHSAIIQSGIAEEGYLRTISAGGNEKPFFQLAMALECPLNFVFDCVQRADVDDIKRVISDLDLAFFPVVDDVTVVRDPIKARNRDKAVRIPVMYGSTGQEASLFVRSFFEDGNVSVPMFLTMFLPDQDDVAPKVIKKYDAGRGKPYRDSMRALTAFITDSVFTCQVSKEATRSARRGIPTWRYFFNASFANLEPFENAHAYHTSELPILFDVHNPIGPPASREQSIASRSMMAAWTNFVKGPTRGPGWPALEGKGSDQLGMWSNNGLRSQVDARVVDEPCKLVGDLHLILPAVFH